MKSIKTICDQVAEGVLCTRKGSCGTFAIIATHKLFIAGHTKFKIVFGWVKDQFLPKAQHIWLEMEDGTIIDPTIEQFAKPVTYHKTTKAKYTPQQFLDMPAFNMSNPATIKMMVEYVNVKR